MSVNRPSDLSLLVREMAASGDEHAYKQVFSILFGPVMNFAMGIVKNREEAEEIASDVLFMIWDHREKLLTVKNVRYYAFVSAKNKALNILKARNPGQVISLEDIETDWYLEISTPEHILINEELRTKLQHSVEKLPKQCRLVFQLIKEEGFSYKEVADMLSISTKTVDAHLVNAVKKLTILLKSEYNI